MEVFGRYVLLERIGLGGMAEVFRAVALGQEGFARTVAIKRILPHLAKDDQVTTMLIDEAKLAATLHHPNIIHVLDLGKQGETYFLAMDFVPGRTLTEVINAARTAGAALPWSLITHVLHDVLVGLHYAHTRTDGEGKPLGIIHRDISPDNVMVGFDGRVFLMDFGIARAQDQARLTLAGSLKGKPAYMSPEIVRGSPVTTAVDLYAAAVMAHELCTLKPMRVQKSDVQTLSDVARGGFPSFESMGAQVPPQLADVIYRALQDEPSRRFPDAASFAAALKACAQASGWAWDNAKIAAWMATSFAGAIEDERTAEARYHRFILQARRVTTRKLLRLVAVANGERVRQPGWVYAAGTAAVMAALGGGLAWRARVNAGTPRPVVAVDAGPPAPQVRTVTVATNPAGAELSVGGRPVGRSPREVDVRPGETLEVTATLAGHDPARRMLSHAESPNVVEVVLERTAPTVSTTGSGTLSLQTRPWGRVIIDGKDTGKFTPLKRLALPVGPHRVEVVNAELGVRTVFTVRIADGRESVESRSLR